MHSLLMPSSGSGVLDDILDVTKGTLNTSNSQNLTSEGTTRKGSVPKLYSTYNVNMSQVAESAKGEQEVTLLKMIDVLTGLVQDMVPV